MILSLSWFSGDKYCLFPVKHIIHYQPHCYSLYTSVCGKCNMELLLCIIFLCNYKYSCPIEQLLWEHFMVLMLHMYIVLFGSVSYYGVMYTLGIWLLSYCINFASPFCYLSCTFKVRHSQGNVRHLSHNSMSIHDRWSRSKQLVTCVFTCDGSKCYVITNTNVHVHINKNLFQMHATLHPGHLTQGVWRYCHTFQIQHFCIISCTLVGIVYQKLW